MNAARAAAAATSNITVNEQLIVAESAVAQATSHLELTRADQAHVAADEASHIRKPHPRQYRPRPHVRTNDEQERTERCRRFRENPWDDDDTHGDNDHPLPHRRTLSIGGAP